MDLLLIPPRTLYHGPSAVFRFGDGEDAGEARRRVVGETRVYSEGVDGGEFHGVVGAARLPQLQVEAGHQTPLRWKECLRGGRGT